MNLCDCYVTKILEGPIYIQEYNIYVYKVEADCYGRLFETTLYAIGEEQFKDLQENIIIGYHFLA